MKASDICVGDWLNIYTFPNDNPKQDDLFPAKVSTVSIFDPSFDSDDVLVEVVIPNTNGVASRPLDTCLPIELTEEILVKNGFKKESQTIDGDYCKYILPGFALNWCDTDGFWYQNGDIAPNHVHTLQHLLRLCNVQKEIEL